ncbi:DUF2793 domain-containing protein [Algirhabdus cladophorae]|uniref:DUF2793 domain-containing protein n=1 Tax=Algirhabdus cladophorae TaxID=3377108 RepID=UPI003B84A2B9
MSERSISLSLPFIQPAQAQKHITHNEAISTLDTLVQLTVISATSTNAPTDAELGDSYIIPAAANGDWADHADDVATKVEGGWRFATPNLGWQGYVQDQAIVMLFTDQGWGPALGALNNLPELGIGTTADATNPFSAKLNRALWTATEAANGGTGDVVQALNKETSSDDAGFTFQTGYATHAVFGSFGSDTVRLATTTDGTTFKDAFEVDAPSGVLVQPNLPRFRASTNFDNLAAEATWVKVAINQTEFNDQGVFDPATSLFTAPLDGTYAFGGFLAFKRDITSNVRLRGRFVKNGTDEVAGSSNELASQPTHNLTGLGLHTLVHLTAGDTVELQGYFRLGSGYFKADNSVFWGYKIG